MKNHQGIIQTIALIIIGLLVLSALGFNLREIIESDLVQENFSYTKNLFINIWGTYIYPGIIWLINLVKSI